MDTSWRPRSTGTARSTTTPPPCCGSSRAASTGRRARCTACTGWPAPSPTSAVPNRSVCSMRPRPSHTGARSTSMPSPAEPRGAAAPNAGAPPGMRRSCATTLAHGSLPMTASLPLAGLKVVELHAIGPVPFAGQLLRSLGADVLRVSPPNDPGLGVNVGPEYDLLNAGKRTLAIDLKHDDGRAALRGVLADADVLLEGFRPGVLERLGFAPAALLAAHPRLVVGRLSGWGRDGVLAERAGHDINYLALAGVLNAIGAHEAPVPPLNLVADFGGGAMHLLV